MPQKHNAATIYLSDDYSKKAEIEEDGFSDGDIMVARDKGYISYNSVRIEDNGWVTLNGSEGKYQIPPHAIQLIKM